MAVILDRNIAHLALSRWLWLEIYAHWALAPLSFCNVVTVVSKYAFRAGALEPLKTLSGLRHITTFQMAWQRRQMSGGQVKGETTKIGQRSPGG